MSVLPIGPAIACSGQFAGATADIDIFYSMRSDHELMMKKMEGEDEVVQYGALHGGERKRIL